MDKPFHLIKLLICIAMSACFQTGYAQIPTDSIPTDTTVQVLDSIHPFHRKKGDVLNYLIVDNFNNPAVAGSLKSYQAQVSYGCNVPGSPNNRHYGQVMLDMYFGNTQGRHGLGYRMSMNHIGFTNGIRQRFDYSFQALNKKDVSIRFGTGVGFVMEQQVKTNLAWGDMIDDRYGFIYATQETKPDFSSAAFKISRFQWNLGAQFRIYDGYINVYNTNDLLTILPDSGNYQNYYPGVGANGLYNIDLKIVQLVPSVQFNWFAPEMYILQGGVFLASNTSKGGGGGFGYNNNNIFSVSGLFAWEDYLRVYAQVQIPFSDIRLSYPVSNFQLTVSYKINDLRKYE